MTSEEIRSFEVDDLESASFRMLQEVAAQLADLNEHFRQVDEHVFGDPRKG